jgi:hypothetical protein
MGNKTLRWEKTNTFNIGFDFAAFKNVLFGSVDFYHKKGTDIIGTITLPSVVGATSQKLNNAETLNRGIEIELGVNSKITDKIAFSTKVTYAYNHNEVTKLFYPSISGYDMLSGGANGYGFVEGYPANAMWAYNYLGMEEGIPYVEGIDGAKVSFSDVSLHNRGLGLQYLQYMGPIIDPHTLGWLGSFHGYGFNFSVLLTGKFGGHFRNPTFNYNMVGTGKNIVPMFIEEVFNGSGNVPDLPLPNTASAYLWDRYTPNLGTMVESSSFIKLKEITLEYILPRKWIDAVGLGAVKMYAQVRNLGCLWVANSRGYDPEWIPGSLQPSTSYAFGLNINFK